MQIKIIKTIIIELLVISFFMIPESVMMKYAVYKGCPFQNYFLYMFFHGTYLHLVINMLCFYVVEVLRSRDILVAYMISIVCAVILNPSVPTVGFSGMLMAITGMYAGRMLSYANRRLVVALFVINTLVSLLNTSIAVWLHVMCFAIAYFLGRTETVYRLIMFDYNCNVDEGTDTEGEQ